MKVSRSTGFFVILSVGFVLVGSVLAKKRDERPTVKAVEGTTISLTCDHGSVNSETLYAVKWYKDEKEFFRNYPKAENPVTVYPIDGFKLQMPLPSPWQVVLQNVATTASGKYTCMVVDFPRYRTIYRSTQVEIAARNDSLHQSHQPASSRKRNSSSTISTSVGAFSLTVFILVSIVAGL